MTPPIGFDAVRVIIWCPNCHEQHIDDEFAKPHIVHRCAFCDVQWKFSEWNTLGILSLPNTDYFARNAKPKCFATLKDFDDAVKYATKHLEESNEQLTQLIKKAVTEAVPKAHWLSEMGCPLIIIAIAILTFAIAFGKWLVLK